MENRERTPGIEFPFFCEPVKAKLFWRFTPYEELVVEDATINFEANYYRTYKKIKYTRTVKKDDEGKNQPIKGLLIPDDVTTVRTNSHESIIAGDLLEFEGALWNVDHNVKQYVYTPKKNLLYQDLSLTKVSDGVLNINA